MTDNIDFTQITHSKNLVKYIACSSDLFNRILETPDDYVRSFEIRKKKRMGFRKISKVTNEEYSNALKSLGRRLRVFFSINLENFEQNYVHGYTPGKSTLTNSQSHIGSIFLVKADVKNFFDSIDSENIKILFTKLGVNEDVASSLTSFLTHEDRLPLGFPSSPVIANAIFAEFDKKIYAFAKEKNCQYTRYGDDLSFSSKTDFLITFEELNSLLNGSVFSLNKEKFYRKKGASHFM